MTSAEVEPATGGAAEEGGGEDLGQVATLAPEQMPAAPPKPKFDRVGDVADRDRVFEALFEVPVERQKLGRYVVLGTLGRGGMGEVLEAFDRTLDRRVALKVLHRRFDEGHTTRLLREAQALAKLSHPNVVQVYESGIADGQAFIAMELVRGRSLRKWLESDPRPGWRACVEVFVQAGDGLAAAHAQGLVHRDFKPGNAVIDEDGRVRVLDFGLAREQEEAVSSPHGGLAPEADALDTPLTRTGTVLGTPSYMPPEQVQGREAGARSDQFSFCVSLYEAVYGERPFGGDSVATLMEAVVEGRIRPAPKGTKVPAWLRQVLLRGLAVDPEQRWPSMSALLVQLRTRAAPRSRRWIMVAFGLAGGLGLVGAGLAYQADMGQRCVGASVRLEGVWDDARRAQVRAAILGTSLSYAPSTWERVEQKLDDYADAWRGEHTEACMATSVRQEQTEEEMALRMGCLRKRRAQLGAAVDVLAQADAEVVRNAMNVTAGLPSLERCDDLDWLAAQQRRVPPPEDPAVAEQVQAQRERLAAVGAKEDSGKYADALEQVLLVTERAEALGYPPLVAEATLQRGRMQEKNGHYAEAEEDLRQAYALAVEQDHEQVELHAARSLINVVGILLERHDEGRQWGDVARPLAERVGSPLDVALNASLLGDVAAKQGKYPEAEALHQRALQINEDTLGPDDPSLAMSVANVAKMLYRQGKSEEAEVLFRRALQIHETALGPSHPFVAASMSDLASVLVSQGKAEEAEELFRRALRLQEEASGPEHPKAAQFLNNLGLLLTRQGRYEEAEGVLRRALGINEATMGSDHPQVALSLSHLGVALAGQRKVQEAEALYLKALGIRQRVLGDEHPSVANTARSLAILLEGQGRIEEAETHYRRALGIWEETLDAGHPNLAVVLNDLGDVLVGQGKADEAEARYRRAMKIWEGAADGYDAYVADVLTGLAMVGVLRGDFEAAREHAERAVSICEAEEVAPVDLAEARFTLARVLWNDEAERARARALAEQAHEVFAEADTRGERERELAESERWLAEHRVE